MILISTIESMSGMSQALTVKTPLRVKLLEENENHRFFACNGTPTDSVKLALNQLCERSPDWVASGINHGSNASVSILYSGTMAAATLTEKTSAIASVSCKSRRVAKMSAAIIRVV